MFNTFKKFFGKRAEDTLDAPASQFRPAAMPEAKTASQPPFSGSRVNPQSPVVHAGAQSNNGQTAGGATLALPLRSVLARLPDELAKRIRQPEVGEAEIFLPLQTVLPQLVSGAVRISFGELRQSSPPGTFSAGNERDRMMIDLPLGEILARVNPGLLTRRPAQKQVEVPPEVTGPFGGQTKVVISDSPPLKPATPVRVMPEPVEDEFVFKRVNTPIAPLEELPHQAPVTPVTVSPAPVYAIPPAVIPISPALRQMAAPAPATPVFAATPVAPAVAPEPAPIRFNAPPSTAPAQPVFSAETRFLTVSLADLSQSWPEALRQEIHYLNVPSAFIALPFGAIEAALKQGKVAFNWKMIRSWIKPPLATATTSPHDLAVLDLPLKVITPLFLAELRTSKPQKKVVVDAAIPDLFSGASRAEVAATPIATPPPPAPVPATPTPNPTDTNYYVRKEASDTSDDAAVVIKNGPSPGTSFLQRYATPNEIVGKATALEGVGGSLIALPDGLLVASKIPADMNADTLAAFLPSIFGRVSQTTKELRMGELNNLNFTVGHVPWKIFRVGAIYFAAFGIAGQSLPTASLAGLAAELDRKPR
ncbi:MAG: hypothetical protein JWQ71_1129 [Pedosphaera sp.]|nr:hypothetical protein [Pedosphaera sp.]